MDNILWYPIGVIAALLGYVTIEDTRRQKGRIQPHKVIWAGAAWLAVYQNFWDFWEYTHTYQLIALALVWLGSSPVIGYILFGNHGKVRQQFGKAVLAIGCGTLSFVVIYTLHGKESLASAFIIGCFAGLLPLLPWKKWKKERAQRRLRRQEQKRQALAEAQEHAQERAEFGNGLQAFHFLLEQEMFEEAASCLTELETKYPTQKESVLPLRQQLLNAETHAFKTNLSSGANDDT